MQQYIKDMNSAVAKDEREERILNCLPMVVNLAKKNRMWEQRGEDLIQAGNEGLCKCADMWDEKKGSFGNFAYHYVEGYQRNWYHREKTILSGMVEKKEVPEIAEFDDWMSMQYEEDPEEDLIKNERLNMIKKELKKLRKEKGHRNVDIFIQLLEDKTLAELAEKYHLTTSRVHQIYEAKVKELKERLKKLIEPSKKDIKRLRKNAWAREYNKRNKEKVREYNARYRKQNLEKVRGYNKRYYSKKIFAGVDQKKGKHKLSEMDVVAIKRHLKEGKRRKEIGEMFGISRQLVYQIAKGKIWGHVVID